MSLIGKNIGNYQIKAKLGEGGMGAVYLGEHPLIGKRVAVKVLLDELSAKEDIVSRFFNEAKAVNDIGHSNIVDIVDFGKMKNDFGQDIVYFIMEFLDGESLAARLRRTGLAFKETLHVIEQCCSALAASHAKGIVHRDLKPENIYLCPRGNDKNFVKLLDFGIAKLTGDGGASSHKTRTGLVIGTPAYMSPEQCEGKGHIDSRSDVYSLGVVMYELLTGRVPFPGEGFGEILVAHLTKQPEPPSTINPDVTPQLEAVVMHAIEKDRTRRFQTMAEFQAAVENPEAHFASWQGVPQSSASTSHSGGTMVLDEHAPRSPTGAQRPITGQRGPMTGTNPRPTTLSGAASETLGSEVPRKSRTPVYAGIGVAAGVAIAIGLVTVNKKPAPVEPLPSAAVAKAESLTVTINSDPAGARATRADTNESHTTPWKLELTKGTAPFDVQIKADGYLSTTRTVSGDKSESFIVTLEKIPNQAQPQPVVPQPAAATASAVATPDKTDKKDRHHRSSAPTTKAVKDSPADKGDKPAGKENDDMKLLQPKF